MRSSKGFTLMEVLTAIAIIAIISGPLLYLFVTSTRVGRHSYDSDKANALSVELIEQIKANPGNWETNGYVDTPVMDEGAELHSYAKTLYFNSDWNITGDFNQADFLAHISLSEGGSGTGVSMSFIPELVVSEGSQAGKDYRIETITALDTTITVTYEDPIYEITDTGSILKNTLNNSTVPITIPEDDCVGGVIPIVVDVEGTSDEIHFKVKNQTSMEIAFYIYGDNDDRHRVTAETTDGPISTNYMQVSSQILDYDTMEVNVVFTYRDGREICDYTTLIYLPGY